jgi:outer membrane protein assembly factor BamD
MFQMREVISCRHSGPMRGLPLLAAVLALKLAGCASDNERDMKSGAEQLYERAHNSMSSGNYRNAISYYEVLEARFPFSNQAKQAQLDMIYAYYKNGEAEAAIDAATQFERENPTHPRVDYALYMRGLAQFSGQHNWFDRLLRLDRSKRPPIEARESFSAFAQLLQRYPDSLYAADARQRMIFLRNRLAEHENHVARYYVERGAWMAGLNRAKYAMENYDGAPSVAESLRIIITCYDALGMKDLADGTRRVLAESYPDITTAQAAAEDKPWYRFW